MTDDERPPERAAMPDEPAAEPDEPATDVDFEPDEMARARAEQLRRIVLHKSIRRARARRRGHGNIWSWMGTFGMVGWTVAIPTLLGVALGAYLDKRIDSSVSFTITCLVTGSAVGVWMAWYWVRRESEGDDGP